MWGYVWYVGYYNLLHNDDETLFFINEALGSIDTTETIISTEVLSAQEGISPTSSDLQLSQNQCSTVDVKHNHMAIDGTWYIYNGTLLCKPEPDGWLAWLRRVDGSVLFNRTWDEYVAGFGARMVTTGWVWSNFTSSQGPGQGSNSE